MADDAKPLARACICACAYDLSYAGSPRGVFPEKLGMWPASQNPYPIYDQNLRFSLRYL